jgi:hypothetical protein
MPGPGRLGMAKLALPGSRLATVATQQLASWNQGEVFQMSSTGT